MTVHWQFSCINNINVQVNQMIVSSAVFFLFHNKTMIHVLPWENIYALEKHMTLYNMLASCCFSSSSHYFTVFSCLVYIDIGNMFGMREREKIIDKHSIKRKSKQSGRNFCFPLPLLYVVVVANYDSEYYRKNIRTFF